MVLVGKTKLASFSSERIVQIRTRVKPIDGEIARIYGFIRMVRLFFTGLTILDQFLLNEKISISACRLCPVFRME